MIVSLFPEERDNRKRHGLALAAALANEGSEDPSEAQRRKVKHTTIYFHAITRSSLFLSFVEEDNDNDARHN